MYLTWKPFPTIGHPFWNPCWNPELIWMWHWFPCALMSWSVSCREEWTRNPWFSWRNLQRHCQSEVSWQVFISLPVFVQCASFHSSQSHPCSLVSHLSDPRGFLQNLSSFFTLHFDWIVNKKVHTIILIWYKLLLLTALSKWHIPWLPSFANLSF